MTKKTVSAGSKEESKSKRPYPRVLIADALKIPQAIKDKNGGNPWPPAEVATAVGSTPRSPGFFYKTSASQAFGFTKGTREASKIELEQLGRDVVYAPSPEIELENKRRAFFNVAIFKSVFEYYKGSQLPEAKYLSNTLEHEFKLTPSYHDEFIKLFAANCKYLGLDSSTEVSQPGISQGRSSDGERQAQSESTIILSEAKDKNANEVFVIMPFSERHEAHSTGFFSEVLASLITPAAADAGFTVRTARRTGSDVIQSTIINALLNADLVVADLTEHNPNVLFELGVRMALEKPILLIRAQGTEKIFDVDSMLRVFDYDPNLWPTTLKTDVPELTKHIRAAWENRIERSYMELLKLEGSAKKAA